LLTRRAAPGKARLILTLTRARRRKSRIPARKLQFIRPNGASRRLCSDPGQNCATRHTVRTDMKHPTSQKLFHHWDLRRYGADAPDQTALDLEMIGDVLGDAFVASGDDLATASLSFAGSRLSALFNQDLRHRTFPGRWSEPGREALETFFAFAAQEQVGTLAGVRAMTTRGAKTLELLLLPLMPVAGMKARLIGSLAPMAGGIDLSQNPELDITSWRHVGPASEPARALPRLVRKARLACGFLAYEGVGVGGDRL